MLKAAFYIIYSTFLLTRKDKIDSIILAFITFSTILSLNFLSGWGVFYKLGILNSFFNSAVPIIVIFGISFFITFLLFIRKKRFLTIKSEFDQTKQKLQKAPLLLGIIYLVISFFLFAITLFFFKT